MDGVVTPRQRVALVSSLLWVFSIPFFFMIATNQNANNLLSLCVAQAHRTHEDESAAGAREQNALKTAEDQCLQDYRSASIAPQQIVPLLRLHDNREQGVDLWALILSPLILFWIAAGIATVSAHWLRQIFRRHDAVSRLARMRPAERIKADDVDLQRTFQSPVQ